MWWEATDLDAGAAADPKAAGLDAGAADFGAADFAAGAAALVVTDLRANWEAGAADLRAGAADLEAGAGAADLSATDLDLGWGLGWDLEVAAEWAMMPFEDVVRAWEKSINGTKEIH